MVISLTSFDETWKWDKYAAALPVSQAEIVKSRYAFALLMALVGFVVALAANLIAQAAFGAGVWAPACCWRWLLLPDPAGAGGALPLQLPAGGERRGGGDDPVPGGHPGPVVLGQGHGVRMAGLGGRPCLSPPWLGCGVVAVLFVLSYVLSVSLFRRKFR